MENVLFIYPPQSFGRKRTSEGLAPPLGLLYMKEMIPECNVKILDLSVQKYPRRVLKETLESEEWGVVGITILTYCLYPIHQIIELIKKKNDVYLIGGGAHATLAPDDCLKMGFDAVVVGEGELIISDLIYNKPNGIIIGKAFRNLDEIPYPDRINLDNTKYGSFGFLKLNGLSTSIMTSRGCPFNCSFCGRIVKGSIRRRSVTSVINELKELKKQRFDNIFIADDHFITQKTWITDFCQALKRERLKFNFFYQTRIDNFDKKQVKALRESGTQYIGFGIESIHPDVLEFYNKTNKPTMWQNNIVKVLEYCDEIGIYSQASLIIGAPMETEEMFWKSYDFVRDHGADTINVNPLTYMVGSKIWNDAVQKGMIKEDEYLMSVSDRKLCPIPPKRIQEICSETFEKTLKNFEKILIKTLKHIDLFRVKLLTMGIKEFISWNFLGGNWRKHSDILREFGYGKNSFDTIKN